MIPWDLWRLKNSNFYSLKLLSFATKTLQINNKLNQPTINSTQPIADKRVWIHLTNINPGVWEKWNSKLYVIPDNIL